jgi:hypothetical protein
MGLEFEKFLTGAATEREEWPLPESIRRMQESNPGVRLAMSRQERLQVEDELKSLLVGYHLVVTADDVRDTLGPEA